MPSAGIGFFVLPLRNEKNNRLFDLLLVFSMFGLCTKASP